MPYEHIENIRSRRDERIAILLTFENALGLLVLGTPTYLLSAPFEWWLRIPLTLLGCAIGIGLTLDTGGMAIYERLIWRLRGIIRIRLSGGSIHAEDLPGLPHLGLNTPVLPANGPILPNDIPISPAQEGIACRSSS
ncbi:MAG: hypothetical protein Fur005_22370 [Roseiflexaceae bacterium]